MKKLLIGIPILISIVLLGMFLILKDWWKNEQKPETVERHVSIRQETQSREEIIQRFDSYNKAMKDWDESLCESVVWDDDMKIRCSEEILTAKAEKEMDISLCDKLIGKESLQMCKNNFFHKKATISWDRTFCNSIIWDSGLMNICRTDKALWIKKEEKKNPDIEILTSTMQTNDLNACSSILSKELQTKCINDIYFRRAISENNPSLCENINDVPQRNQCENDTRIINQEDN